jgi:outer membrane protein assembly factor BamB
VTSIDRSAAPGALLQSRQIYGRVLLPLFAQRLGAALACAFLLGACASVADKLNPFNWFGADSPNKPADLKDIKATLTLTPAWRASVGGADQFAFSPALAGDTLYAAGSNGDLAAFEAVTGTQKWRVQASKEGLSAGVGAAGETIVVATVKGDILAFDTKGREKWKTQVSSEVLAAPLVTADAVFVRSNDNRVYAFAASDGRRLWSYQRTAPALILRNFAGFSASADTLYAGFPGGKLAAINSSNGTLRWEGTVALPKGATELERIADITSSPVISTRDVCAVAFQGRVACFDVSNGQPLWTREVSSFMGMTFDARYVFVADEKSAMVALARTTGSSLWRQDQLSYRRLSAPVSLARAVVVGDFQGVLHALSREEGSLIGRAQTDGSAITAPPIALTVPGKEMFVVQTRGGGVFAFSL